MTLRMTSESLLELASAQTNRQFEILQTARGSPRKAAAFGYRLKLHEGKVNAGTWLAP